MSRVHINATRCVEYLRSMGIAIADDTASAWVEMEATTRRERRANKRELRRSCGHFSDHWTRIFTPDDGAWDVRYCWDCRIELERRRPPPPKHREPIPTARTA